MKIRAPTSTETRIAMTSISSVPRPQNAKDTLDGCKRIYRGIAEAARQMEEKQLRTTSCSQLFSPELVASRIKIADVGMNLALREPTVFGKKCEEVIWRKAFYSAYVQAKHLLRTVDGNAGPEANAPLVRHLMAGIGFYHSFILEIQAEYQVRETLDLCSVTRLDHLSTHQNKVKLHEVGAVDWARSAVQRNLIALGDLHRYLSIHVANSGSDVQAARFYTMASHMDPKSSMPFNQLGTLSLAKGKKLDAAFYYLRCLISDTPFDGAEANLRQVLRHPPDGVVFLGNFLSLVHAWWFSENSIDVNIISEDCIMEFKHIILAPADNSAPLFCPDVKIFNSEFLVKMTAVCIMSFDHLKKQNSDLAASVMLFILSTFHCLSTKLINGSLPLLEKKPADKKKKLGRRRTNGVMDDSDESEDEEASNSSELSSSESESEDESSDGSSTDSEKAEETPLLKGQDLAALGSIKLCCDWLRSDPEVLRLLSTNFRSILADFVKLLNILNYDCKQMLRVMRIKDPLEKVLETAEPCPLPEDAILRNYRAPDQTNINWNLSNFSPYKSDNLLRISKLVNFGMFLTHCPEGAGLKYDAALGKFILSDELPASTLKVVKKQVEKPKKQNKDQQKKLMQSMGQLWLQEEVKNLEGKVNRSHNSCVLSPYLILDSSAILLHLHTVKQLVLSKKFVLIVPIIVLESLDEIKKESAKAREAIRWLETQFHKGNRFLRAQRPNEALAIPLIKCPKKKEKETWTYFQVLECCNFLAQQVKRENQEAHSNLATLLTAEIESSSKDFSLIGLATSIGISVESISDFSLKLKSVKKKKGA